MPDELEERLKSHARAFDSLLSLIPAKLYYGEDVSDQWKRKKQTPEQKRAAKMAKLDPDNWKSAKDVMDERAAAALKRKREEDGDESEEQLVEPEKPKVEQDSQSSKAKRRKVELDVGATGSNITTNGAATGELDEEEKKKRKAEQRAEKKERKKQKKEKAREKAERQKARKKEAQSPASTNKDGKPRQKRVSLSKGDIDGDTEEDDTGDIAEPIDIGLQNASILATTIDEHESSSASDIEQPQVFSPHAESGSSSISSVQIPPSTEALSKPAEISMAPSSTQNTEIDSQTPRERLQAALTAFRSDRKAVTNTGPRNRQELLEERRLQEERRRAAKKEQRRREKEEEARIQEEEIAKRFSPGGSGSLLASPRSPLIDSVLSDSSMANNFSFGRIAFDDGTQLDPSLSNIQEPHKKKGPQDPQTALRAAQAKHSRLSGLDQDKRSTIEQKDMWLNARKRASGEKVKDDTSLLKKTLKRHEGQKKKSEKEWTERKEGVAKGIEMRQKKRTENLAKRKDEKNGGGGKKPGGGGKNKKVKRPGFEGSFKGRTGGGKKSK